MRCPFPQSEEREKRPIAPSRIERTLLPSREEASACADLTSPPGFQALRPAERGRQQPTGQAETVMATILAEPAGRRPRPARRLPVARVAYIHCDRDGWRGWGRGPGYSIYFAGGDAGIGDRDQHGANPRFWWRNTSSATATGGAAPSDGFSQGGGSATATSTAIAGGSGASASSAIATGGDGDGLLPPGFGEGGYNSGAGGSATATSTASTGSGDATSSATATGGDGAAGSFGGEGGSANAISTATSGSGSAFSSASATSGVGGLGVQTGVSTPFVPVGVGLRPP